MSTTATITSKLGVPYHPILLAVFFTLHFYSNNFRLGGLDTSALVFAISILVAIAALVAFRFAFGDGHKGGIAGSALVMIFFSYSHIHTEASKAAQVDITNWLFVMPFVATIVALAAVLRYTQRPLSGVTRIANWTAVVLVVIVLANTMLAVATTELLVAPPSLSVAMAMAEASGSEHRRPSAPENAGVTHPDIYYIIPDRYASTRAIHSAMRFDNSVFEDQLRGRGFVLPDVQANYDSTHFSIPSTMHMQHIHDESMDHSTVVPKSIIYDNEVVRVFKSNGYSIVNVHSNIELTNDLRLADANLCVPNAYDSHLLRYYLQSTILKPLSRHVDVLQRGVIECALDAIPKASDLAEEPAFVFAHMLIPHEPYVFDRHGKIPQGTENPYVGQLQYLNKRLTEVVDQILERDEESVIIIQADHGLSGTRVHDAGGGINNTAVNNLLGVISAYRFYDGADDVVYDGMTSVNTFRVIFDRYLGTGYGLEEDVQFITNTEYGDGGSKNVSFLDVTDRRFGSG